MTDKSVRVPGPDHPIDIAPATTRMTVTFAGRIIADSAATLILREAGYQPVYYFPRGDVDAAILVSSDKTSYCPYKGTASYFTINADGKTSPNAIWTYENPHDAVLAIKDYVAFYPDRVAITHVE
ncbi:DUF427 domain-containing protein [Thalassospira mesophila]|uniref:DUF427 domain-containing protein n=1 Tax=Thalassospira mesophila TaxID=1293891 RepID=A0A1Y2KXU1_9PROT|nr:DUF427 domain-containing protein [Thalassospira mesophila]OSQ36791.1 hypothetical protein TMES_17145 [Thalassospira mesophila]